MVKINWIEFENLETGLKCERVYFNDDVTLLVGGSGAGKTQIINTIRSFCGFVSDPYYGSKKTDGFNAKMSFSIDQDKYVWEIKTNRIIDCIGNFDFETSSYKEPQGKIKYEKLSYNGEKVFIRENNKIDWEYYQSLPTPDSETSLIFQYRNDKHFRKIASHLNKLHKFYINENNFDGTLKNFNLQELKTISKMPIYEILKNCDDDDRYLSIFPSEWSPVLKIWLLEKTKPCIFDKVIQLFRDSFPDIIDIKTGKCKISNDCTIIFKTENANIEFKDMSSGMQKTFIFLLDLFTFSSDYVFLIDEIENSLGVNCLSNVCNVMQLERDDLQFIITSHHPYIINNIDINAWQIVRRKKNIIYISTSEKEGLLESRHESFDKLQNLLQYGDKR